MSEHIKFKCGHTEPKQPGKRCFKPQERLCFECYKKQRLLEAEKRAAEVGLPQLRGTQKQVAWALVTQDSAKFWIEEEEKLRRGVLDSARRRYNIVEESNNDELPF